MSDSLRSLDLETLVLQCAIVSADVDGDNKGWEAISALTAEDFTFPGTKAVFAECDKRYKAGKLMNTTFLMSAKHDAPVEAVRDVINWGSVPDRPFIRAYVAELRELTVRRQVFHTAMGSIFATGNYPHWSLGELKGKLGELVDKILGVSDTPIQHGADWARLIIEGHEGDTSGRFVTTGFDWLDRQLGGGYRRKFFNVVGGYSGTGKTNVMLHNAIAAVENGYVVGYISQEMTDEAMTERLGSMLTGNTPRWMSADEVVQCTTQVAGWGTRWNFTERRSDVPQIEAFAEDIRNINGAIDILFVDYIQLTPLSSTASVKDNRYREIGIIAERMGALAKRLNCAVVVGAQLGRGAVMEEPNLTHLRESGDIECTARVVVLLDRPHYRDKDVDKNELHLIVAKQSQGETDVAHRLRMVKGFTLESIPTEGT